MKQNEEHIKLEKEASKSLPHKVYVDPKSKKAIKNKLFDKIVFRLFVNEKPVGFACWNSSYGENLTYTTGEPEKIDGWKEWGWSGTKIGHNRKEIIEINYV